MPLSRRLTLDLDVDRVRPIVSDLDRSLRPTGVSRLAGGLTEVYRLDFAAGAPALVLKLYADEPAWFAAKEALVAGWIAKACDLPIPQWFVVDESRTRLPLRFAITSLLPGTPMRSFRGDAHAAAAYRQMGAMLRRLHIIAMPAFGYVMGSGIEPPHPSNGAHMADAFEQAFRRFRDHSGDAASTRRLEEAVSVRFDLLTVCERPVLLHQDFQPGNVLAERRRDGGLSLTGVIDFANARAGDPLMDLATALSCCAHEDPSSRAPLLEGYGAADHPDVAGALKLYEFYHQLTLWGWFMQIGEPGEAGPASALSDFASGP
ncbi:MAG TPA: aminoglycoside phosphotransferase family protein [Caulobacteraceae bacterium]|nr:aminoglycoside phosphotransferase family protein [Caulobacteraceae bacterium]